MSVVIDNESGAIIGAFDAKREKPPKKKRASRRKTKAILPTRRQFPQSPQVQNDIAAALGAVRAIFDTADHIADIFSSSNSTARRR